MSTVSTYRILRQRGGMMVILLAIVLPLATQSCAQKQKTVAMEQKTFTSAEQAGAALLDAAKSGDENQMLAIFGPNDRGVLFTGDPPTDKARLNGFVTAYNQMHRWGNIKAGGQVLIVGVENIVFPIPLGKNSSGQWYFDTAAGKDEILARRIGKEELNAMDATKAIAQAEQQYRRETHDGEKVNQYAHKFVSDPGKHNGLYWPARGGQTPSPLGKLGDFARALSSTNAGSDPEFNGYRYRILYKGRTPAGVKEYIVNGRMTGGVAILAWPVEYRNSGIASFLIGPDGTLYEKDLGEDTANVAAGLTEYNPADGWTPASAPDASASRTQR